MPVAVARFKAEDKIARSDVSVREFWLGEISSLLAAAGLYLDEDVDERTGGGGDAGDSARLAERARADALKFFIHLARESADRGVVEPLGDAAFFGPLEAFDRFLLLLEISGVLDFGLDGLEFVAE